MRAFRVRRLTPGGDTLFARMLDLFAEVFEDRATYCGNRPGPAYVNRLLADPAFVALVALDGDEAVGALAAYELLKFEQERSEFYIYDLAVAATHRRRGIATALISEVRAIARSRGGWVVMVQADHGDHPAVALYNKLGTREDVLQFDIAVDGET